ncbi:hypothetical protein ACIQM4_08090 [Streptomyces sp. NPDC091272]|uniref:hypothetical protein n=1 Tax=Streptomyces sp. NPDC091272 TaxID=3365981 RepID=UPI00382D17B6
MAIALAVCAPTSATAAPQQAPQVVAQVVSPSPEPTAPAPAGKKSEPGAKKTDPGAKKTGPADMKTDPAAKKTGPADMKTAATRHGVGGKVTAHTGQIVRSRPTTKSANIGSYGPHAIVRIACKVRGQNVAGNTIWFKLWNRSGWMSAKYVDNFSYVGWCR